MLIDLDRAVPVATPYAELRYKEGVMYKAPENAPEGWNAGHVDWRQLGYMIAYCYQDRVIKDYHHMTVCDELENDPFVDQLLGGEQHSFIILALIVYCSSLPVTQVSMTNIPCRTAS